jgi:hypothetical protein
MSRADRRSLPSLTTVLALLAAAVSIPALPAQIGSRVSGRERLARSGGEGKEIAAAVQKGLTWLKKRQGDDGDFRELRKAEPRIDALASGALALLAFSGDGSTRDAGPFRSAVRDGTKWLMSCQSEDGRLALGDEDDDRAAEPLLGHALATFALYEIGLLSADNRLLLHAQRAIAFAEACRLPDGTWPTVVGDANTDFRTTVWMLHGLLEARRTTLPIDEKGIARAEEWLQTAAADDAAGEDARAHNAAGAFLLILAGRNPRGDELLQSAAERVASSAPEWNDETSVELLYFGSHLLYQTGGEGWKGWRDGVLREVRAWLPKPKSKRTIERAASAALALMSFYRYGPLGR